MIVKKVAHFNIGLWYFHIWVEVILVVQNVDLSGKKIVKWSDQDMLFWYLTKLNCIKYMSYWHFKNSSIVEGVSYEFLLEFCHYTVPPKVVLTQKSITTQNLYGIWFGYSCQLKKTYLENFLSVDLRGNSKIWPKNCPILVKI